MKVLDAYCGKGGLARPFVYDGDEVYGVDIADFSKVYPGKFQRLDVRRIHLSVHDGFDLVMGSPPCVDFSTAGQINKSQGKRAPDLQKGLALVLEFNRLVREARPRFWFMENVKRMEKFYVPPPTWRFRTSYAGVRSIWANFPIPPLVPDFRFSRRISTQLRHRKSETLHRRLTSAQAAEIPYPIARFLADTIKRRILEAVGSQP